jgi:hypothetical protein
MNLVGNKEDSTQSLLWISTFMYLIGVHEPYSFWQSYTWSVLRCASQRMYDSVSASYPVASSVNYSLWTLRHRNYEFWCAMLLPVWLILTVCESQLFN